MVTKKKLVRKLKAGEKDERQAIKYYAGFTKAEKARLSKKGRKSLTEVKNDEKQHLKILKRDVAHVRKRK